MPHSPLTNLSPLDGRYAAKLDALRPLLSEYGLMHRRVQVEVEWFIALSDAGMPEFPPLPAAARERARAWVREFGENDALAIKNIERTTNHDVKAVEYWLKDRMRRRCAARAVARVRALRLHQRGHQQHQPRADAAKHARAGAVAGDRPHRAAADRDGPRVRRRADAQPHARPDREPDHAGQGDRQRRRAPGSARARRSPKCSRWPR